ncbi:MAG: alanine--tRNA ligase, partial [Halanaerobiales bacterium]
EDVVGGEGDRYLEIWNLVFTQYDKTEEGEYLPLPSKNIDTGMGLERVASILQDVDSNFETDLLKPMIDFTVQDSGIEYDRSPEIKNAFRVIADHSRGVTMAIFDGALPSNEGRGYVIRRILRRAVRYGKKLGYEEPFLYRLVPVVIDTMQGGYPELKKKQEHLKEIIKAEEERFLETLDQGLEILSDMIGELKEKKEETLTGGDAFKLYDTYGFPLDLTADILEEEGLKVDREGFEVEMEKQRERARQAREEVGFSTSAEGKTYKNITEEVGESDFTGYESLKSHSRVLSLLKDGREVQLLEAGEEGEIILDKTPFYAESGGQIGDEGWLRSGDNLARVNDTVKRSGLSIHRVKVEEGNFEKKQSLQAEVSADLRKATARNHSATHLLHKSLKKVLGEHVNQSGSLVEPGRLRFDFNHFSAMTEEEIRKAEEMVNKAILDDLPVETVVTSIEKAKKMGATALFGEKYGKEVRVVIMDDFSRELCGGTHVENTGEIGLFKIVNESGIAAGVRRIEAITGTEVMEYINRQQRLIQKAAELLKTDPEKITGRIENLLQEQKEMQNRLNSMKDRLANSRTDELLNRVEEVGGVSLLTAELDGLDSDSLRKLSDQLKEKIESGIIILASNLKEKVLFVAAVTEDLVEQGYHAGKIIGRVAKITGGGGGGRPDMAQAGGRDVSRIQEALRESKKIIINI